MVKKETSLIVEKFKYLLNDFLKICKRVWDLAIDITTFCVQFLTFWEFLLNTGIARKVGMFLSNLKFR